MPVPTVNNVTDPEGLETLRNLDRTFYPDDYDFSLDWYRALAKRTPLAFWALRLDGRTVGSAVHYPLAREAWDGLARGEKGEEDLPLDAVPAGRPHACWYGAGVGLRPAYRGRGLGRWFTRQVYRRILASGGFAFPFDLAAIPVSPEGERLLTIVGTVEVRSAAETVDGHPRRLARYRSAAGLARAFRQLRVAGAWWR